MVFLVFLVFRKLRRRLKFLGLGKPEIPEKTKKHQVFNQNQPTTLCVSGFFSGTSETTETL